MATTAVNGIFEIPEKNYAKFRAEVAKLSKRSLKLTGEEIIAEAIGTTVREFPRKNGKGKYSVTFIQVIFDAPVISLSGWTFAARIDHSNDGGNVIRAVPNSGVEIPAQYRNAGPDCDHCNHQRKRRDTFLLVNQDGEFAQVGTTCLRDFLGHDALGLAKRAELLAYADEMAHHYSEYDEGLRDNRSLHLEGFLEYVAMEIRQHGWKSGAKAREEGSRSTAEIALGKYNYYEGTPTSADEEVVGEALHWARELAEKPDLNDYEHNVVVLSKAVVIEFRSAGLAASIVGSYLMAVARRRKREQDAVSRPVSQPLGRVGERMANIEFTVEYARAYNGDFGPSTLVRGVTATGSVVSFYTNKPFEHNVGDTIVMSKATVVKQEPYNGVMETKFNRVVLTK